MSLAWLIIAGMKIHFQNILEDGSVEEKAINLYLSAFPEYERPEYSLMKEKALEGKALLEAALDEENAFQGITFLVPYKDILYLYFLAVREEVRNHGTGSDILTALKETYKDKRIILNIESLRHLQNGEEELKRRRLHFYERNGFRDLGYCSVEWTIYFDMLGASGYVAPEEYMALMESLFGKELLKGNLSIAY